MTDDVAQLDPQRLAELFDIGSDVYATRGGSFDGDISAMFHALRESGPVHEGVPGPLVGYHGEGIFQGLPYPDRRHFTVFDFATCDAVVRDNTNFMSSDGDPANTLSESNMLFMDGERHRRYRTLVQPSFVPKKAQWWIDRWIHRTVHALIDSFENDERVDLNVAFCAPIPLLTICGSCGVTVPEALDIRAAVTSDGLGLGSFIEIVAPIIERRRAEPGDDLISVLVQAELIHDDGTRQVLSNDEVLGFAFLLLAAGSGTTWKQMGIALLALLNEPRWIDAVRRDRPLLRNAIEESVRWMVTDPVFARFAAQDTSLAGVDIPADSVVHVAFGAANRDPARWERPDDYDPTRPLQPHLGFGSGPHVCLGMHVARAEMFTAISALLDRLPNLRLDTEAPPPRVTGMYERGPTAVPVRLG